MEVNVFRDRIVDLELSKIRNEVEDKFNKRLHQDVIYDIVNSQFLLMENAFLNLDTFKIPLIGKFEVKTGRKVLLREQKNVMPKMGELPKVNIVFKKKVNEVSR